MRTERLVYGGALWERTGDLQKYHSGLRVCVSVLKKKVQIRPATVVRCPCGHWVVFVNGSRYLRGDHLNCGLDKIMEEGVEKHVIPNRGVPATVSCLSGALKNDSHCLA